MVLIKSRSNEAKSIGRSIGSNHNFVCLFSSSGSVSVPATDSSARNHFDLPARKALIAATRARPLERGVGWNMFPS